MSRRLKPVFAALVVLVSSALLAQQTTTGTIVGQVSVAGRGSLERRLLVRVETRGTLVSDVYTDTEGKFYVSELPSNNYQIIINEAGYQPWRSTVSVDTLINRTSLVNIQLTPTGPGAQSKPSAGSSPYMVDLARLSRNFPKRAIDAYEEGLKADAKGNFMDAIPHYRKALEIAPDFYPARNNLASDLLANGDSEAAYPEFLRVIKENQADATSYFNLANLFLLTKRYAEAASTLQEGFRRQPESAFGHFIEGVLYSRTAKPREAEQALKVALQLDPSMGKVHLELVNLYMQEHNEAAALQQLREFTSSFPKDPLTPKAQQLARRLEDAGVKASPLPR